MTNIGNVSLQESLRSIRAHAASYFNLVVPTLSNIKDAHVFEQYWRELTKESKEEANKIISELVELSAQLGTAINRSPLLTEADARQASKAIKCMRSSLRFQEFQSWGPEAIHDEGTVFGVRPSGQNDLKPLHPPVANIIFNRYADELEQVIQLVSGGESVMRMDVVRSTIAPVTGGYRSGTAFIMMWLDDNHPELVDISETVKRCFRAFGIEAKRANDIQHEDIITNKILDEIRTSEFLFADLTGERPSVYYEIGFAHAIGRRVMLFRKTNTNIHFDLAAYNCPEYKNFKELEELLTKRLHSVTGQEPSK